MDARLEQLGLNGVALPTHVPDPANPGRHRAVVPVTAVAGGRREVALGRHRRPVDAGLVLLHLIGGDLVDRHVLRVGVAPAAGIGDVERMDARLRIGPRSDRVGRMAARAGRHLGVAQLPETAAVNRGGILRHLVDPQRRVVALHEGGIGVAPAADLDDLLARRLADEALAGIHGLHARLPAVPAVAVDAAESLRLVDVRAEALDGSGQPLVPGLEVTGRARVCRLRPLLGRPQDDSEEQRSREAESAHLM